MNDQFTSYSTKLERLSDDELHCSAEKLVLVENRTIAKLITHLAEMSSRKTALKLGYKNLYEYCITGLNLSEGAVPARIHVANVSRRFPQLLIALAKSRISLTVAALLAPHLTKDNVDKLISDCAGKKRREPERRGLVQMRSRKKTSQLSLDTLPPRFSSEYTNVAHTNVSFVAVMGGNVRRGQDSKSTTRTRLASFTATRSPFSGSCVRIIIF